MTPDQSTTLLQASMLAAAIATFIQAEKGSWGEITDYYGINFYFVPVVIALAEQFWYLSYVWSTNYSRIGNNSF